VRWPSAESPPSSASTRGFETTNPKAIFKGLFAVIALNARRAREHVATLHSILSRSTP